MGIHFGTVAHAGVGYYFVAPDVRDGKEDADLFLHISAVKRAGIANLKVGDRVSFDVRESRRRKGQLECQNIAMTS